MHPLTYSALGVTWLASAVLCQELARRYGRDEIFYAVSGFLLGPLSLMVFLTPLHAKPAAPHETVKREPRVLEGLVCPECHKHLPPKLTVCACGCEIRWWER